MLADLSCMKTWLNRAEMRFCGERERERERVNSYLKLENVSPLIKGMDCRVMEVSVVFV